MPRSPICIDASLVAALVTAKAQSERSPNLWAEWMQSDIEVVASFLLRCEVVSALRRKVVRGLLFEQDAHRAPEETLSLDITLLDPPRLALQLSI